MNTYQIQALDRIEKNKNLMHAVCHTPIVNNKEAAQEVYSGFQKLSKMEETEIKTLMGLSVDELKKKLGEGDMAAAVVNVQKAFDMVKDAFTGRIQKAMAYDGLKNPMAQTLIVNSGIETANDAGFDMGWTQAFNVIDAQNAEILKVIDVNSMTMLWEMLSSTDEVKFNQFANKKAESLTPRYWGGAIEYSPRELRFVTEFNVNTILTSLRLAAVRMMDRFAYRKIAEMATGVNDWTPTSLNSTFTGGSANIDKLQHAYIQGRKTLNKARVSLLDIATQKEPSIGKKKLKFNTAPIAVGSQEPMLFFHNYKWDSWVRGMQSLGSNYQGVNTPIEGNFVFISSALMPVSGGLVRTENEEQHDDYGFYETVVEKGNADTIAGMLMIPGRRNVIGNFRSPVLFTDVPSNRQETIQVALKMEVNGAKETRQCARVTLGTESL